eukprot:gene26663-biopygen17096
MRARDELGHTRSYPDWYCSVAQGRCSPWRLG